MPDKILISLLSVLFIITGGGTGYTQTPPQPAQLDTPLHNTALEQKIPRQHSTVMLENNHLSVDFDNVTIGEILQAVSQKAGFKVQGGSAALGIKVKTKFTDLELEEGIKRLFSLVQESNYLINYDAKGRISKIIIFAPGTAGSSTQTPASPATRRVVPGPRSAAPATPPPPAVRPAPEVPQTPEDSPAPQVSQPEHPEPQEIINSEEPPVENVPVTPYVPPRRRPAYFPAVRR